MSIESQKSLFLENINNTYGYVEVIDEFWGYILKVHSESADVIFSIDGADYSASLELAKFDQPVSDGNVFIMYRFRLVDTDNVDNTYKGHHSDNDNNLNDDEIVKFCFFSWDDESLKELQEKTSAISTQMKANLTTSHLS